MKKLLALAVAGLSSVAVADDTNTGTIVVTATRTEQPLKNTLAPTTVISRADIEKYQATDISDLLSRVPGVDIARSGGIGSNTGLFLRGSNSNHTLILVDGQRIASATIGTAALQFLNPDQIEQIEIVRGPRSALYGSDAMGGVINIITRKGTKGNQVHYKVGFGSQQTQQHAINVSGATTSTTYSVGLSYLRSHGIDRTIDSSFANGDEDASLNKGINARIKQQIHDRVSIGASYLNNKGETEYDNDCMDTSTYQTVSCAPVTDFEIESASIFADIDVASFWQVKLSTGRNSDSSQEDDDILSDPASVFGGAAQFETIRTSGTLQNDFTISDDHLLTLGYDYYNDEVNSTTTYVNNDQIIGSKANRATFLQYQTSLGEHNLVFGVRSDDNEHYGQNTTKNVDWGWNITDNLQVVASWGTAFKAPTFNDLYWPGSGNPDLNPEESENREIALKGHYQTLEWQLNAFYNEFDNLIQWAPIEPNSFIWKPFNIDEATIKGAELSIATSLYSWDISTNFAFVEPKGADGNILTYRAQRKFNIDIDRQWEQLEFGVSLKSRSQSYVDADNNETLGGYTLVDVRSAFHATDEVKIQFTVKNVLNRKYQTRDKFDTEGVTTMLSLHYTPQS